MTLFDMYKKCMAFIGETSWTGDTTGDYGAMVNSFKDGINDAYMEVARDKYKLDYEEDVYLSSDLVIDLNTLEKPFLRLIRVLDTDGNETAWEKMPGNMVYCKDMKEEDFAKVEYRYMPDPLAVLTDTPVIPESAISHLSFCYAGVEQYYLSEENVKRAAYWHQKWLEALSKVTDERHEHTVLKDSYGITDVNGW
jgi:hypothetical protein